VDLNPFTVKNYELLFEPDGNWTIDSTRTVVTQLNDCDPSIYLSGGALVDERIEGELSTDGADDDFFGFVFGYQDASHFYLFDWKRGDEARGGFMAEQGMSLKVVDADEPLAARDLWPTAGNGSRVRTLYHNRRAWIPAVRKYRFTLDHRPGQITITVTEIRQSGQMTTLASFSVSDSRYANGKFGFYNYSQALTQYRNFKRATLASNTYTYDINAVDPDGGPIAYQLLNGPAGVQLDPVSGLLRWPVSVSQIGTHPIAVRAQDMEELHAEQGYELVIEGPADNKAPVVDAGFDHSLVWPQNRSVLAGNVSDDGLPQETAVSYEWSKASGPGEVQFVDTQLLNTQVAFATRGIYVLRLTATDTQYVRTDEVTINVQ
jgi:hypothetical protein